ncbi:MAG TPA: phosphorylase [Acidobacteriaceae bacterium]
MSKPVACTAIIAALPREVAALVKGWGRRPVGHDIAARNVFVWTRSDAVVAVAGMGAARVALACEAAIAAAPVTRLISAGLAGACDPALRVGDILRASVVIDAKTGERFEATGSDKSAVVVTGAAIASVREKMRLREAYGAAAVEMEAATVARIAQAHGLAFRAVKAISDEAGFAMEGLERFATSDGQFREGAFAVHAALRPRMWGPVMALGRNSARAIHALTGTLTEALRTEID